MATHADSFNLECTTAERACSTAVLYKDVRLRAHSARETGSEWLFYKVMRYRRA
jgi:hypothetical protein